MAAQRSVKSAMKTRRIPAAEVTNNKEAKEEFF
jgi:hypothetical protein